MPVVVVGNVKTMPGDPENVTLSVSVISR